MSLTLEQVEALAPDASVLKAARTLARPGKWSELATNPQAVWGLCAGSGKNPYQTRIDLNGPAFKCSCPSRKFPCKHGVALLLLYTETADIFTATDTPPTWVSEWLTARAKRAEAKPAKKSSGGESQKTLEKRAQRIQDGLDGLELWLQDLLRSGLADTPRKPAKFWSEAAARLVDAQVPGLATLVRECSAIPLTGEGWAGRLLARLAYMHLLIQSYRRFEQLPAPLQADVSALLGIVQSREEVLRNPGVNDTWSVLGRIEEEGDNRLVIQRIWLQGQQTGRHAMLLNYAPQHATAQLDRSWLPGMTAEAELVFYTAAWPLRALVKNTPIAVDAHQELKTEANLTTALQGYQTALTENPWLTRFPMLVEAVIPQLSDGNFYLLDQEQRSLPVTPRFMKRWELLAVSGGQPVTVFSEWFEQQLMPLGVMTEAGDYYSLS